MDKSVARFCTAVQIIILICFVIPCESLGNEWTTTVTLRKLKKVPSDLTLSTFKRESLLVRPRQQVNKLDENRRTMEYSNRFSDATNLNEGFQQRLPTGQSDNGRFIALPVVIW